MKRMQWLFIFMMLIGSTALPANNQLPRNSNGITYPDGWQRWQTIAVSHRHDNKTIRMILGNPIAVKAARSGHTNPWPDGAVIAKVVWKDKKLSHWPSAIGPDAFVHVEFMVKDTEKFADSYGWGWARWVGRDLVPFNQGQKTCISCHTPVKARDWVFTEPTKFPE
ncbi:MAG: cytochrome P460 [Gammaproteobacteria bacterium]|nr:MAG: cytochrome P460 [Gammaproteobacteria bacterium]